MLFPELQGGAPVLDFINTVDPRFGPDAVDLLPTPLALGRWARFAGFADSVHVDRHGFDRALEVRATLDAIFRAVAAGRQPRAADLRKLRDAYVTVLRDARLTGRPGQVRWHPGSGRHVDALLLRVLLSALDLLERPVRIRQCSAESCGWLFVDETKNASRKWCSMDPCGNRDKMRRYRARRRNALARASSPETNASRVRVRKPR